MILLYYELLQVSGTLLARVQWVNRGGKQRWLGTKDKGWLKEKEIWVVPSLPTPSGAMGSAVLLILSDDRCSGFVLLGSLVVKRMDDCGSEQKPLVPLRQWRVAEWKPICKDQLYSRSSFRLSSQLKQTPKLENQESTLSRFYPLAFRG